ncbi:30S ribosomal protein S17 [Candidatus Woesebacteria bacterium]|nr:30S ribosomal protein S17 [Candidatus Woesebacteria bacterium]
MKIFKGKVVSTKLAKTATVEVERIVVHPIYRKRFKRVRKFPVHDEIGVTVGQIVEFVASRPYSSQKKWKITKVVDGKGKVPSAKTGLSDKKIKETVTKAVRKEKRKEAK